MLMLTPRPGLESATDPRMTPLVSIDLQARRFLLKLEYYNPTGSHKDRPAKYITQRLMRKLPDLAQRRLIVSSSGNFAVAMANATESVGCALTVVADALSTRSLLEQVVANPRVKLIVVDEPDANGSHIHARLKMVEELRMKNPRAIYIDQYDNPDVADAYSQTLAVELHHQTRFHPVTLIVPAGTCGTINGLWRYQQSHSVDWQIIPVDAAGSALFRTPPAGVFRLTPGWGNGHPTGLSTEVKPYVPNRVFVSDAAAIRMCFELGNRHGLWLGPSGGASVTGALQYIRSQRLADQRQIVVLIPDQGFGYRDTIYNPTWLDSHGFSHLRTELIGAF